VCDLPSRIDKKGIKSSGETPDKGEQGWGPIHHCAMRQTTKDGRSWWSHSTDDGWGKGRLKGR